MTEERLSTSLRRGLFIGIPLLILAILLASWQYYTQESTIQLLICMSLFLIPAVVAILSSGLRFIGILNARKTNDVAIADLKAIQARQIKAARMRINNLEIQIEQLKTKIPAPPSGSQVRDWLNQDLTQLQLKSIDQTGLRERLVELKQIANFGTLSLAENPIPVMGPGELQDIERIPPTFSHKVSKDHFKHLTARRAYHMNDGKRVDVLYGVYFINYIAVAEDMLATYSFFYDHINGKVVGESISEQYYQDVIAITTTRETRQIAMGYDSEEQILVEDAPTFTIYLAGTEERTVTFVNENYFYEIRERLGLESHHVPNIYWVKDAEQTVKDTIQLLRHYLREHKGDEYQEGEREVDL
jgi:hypothetical protein